MADEVHEQPDEQKPEEEHESVSKLLDRLARDTRRCWSASRSLPRSRSRTWPRSAPCRTSHPDGVPRCSWRRCGSRWGSCWHSRSACAPRACWASTYRRRETARRLSRHRTWPGLRCATRSNASQARWRARPRSGSRTPWCPLRAASSTPVRTCWRRPEELEEFVEQVPEGRAAGEMIDRAAAGAHRDPRGDRRSPAPELTPITGAPAAPRGRSCAARCRRQRLQHDAVRRHRGDAGRVVRRRDLDDVHRAEVDLEAIVRTAHSSSRVISPPGSAVPVPGREGRVEHVDVDGQVRPRRPRPRVRRSRRARPAPMPRSSISPIVCQRKPCSRIHWNSSGNGQAPRRPICTMLWPSQLPVDRPRARTACRVASPRARRPVSACVSKWTTEKPSVPYCAASAARTGVDSEWSPPSTTAHGARREDLADPRLRSAGVDRARGSTSAPRRRRSRRCRAPRRGRCRAPCAAGRSGTPTSSAWRIARGPKRVPGPVGHALVERRADDRDVGAGQPRGLQHERHAAERQADAGVAVLVGAVGLEATLGHEVAIIWSDGPV